MVLVTVKKDVIPTARSDGLTDFSFLTAQALALSPPTPHPTPQHPPPASAAGWGLGCTSKDSQPPCL